MINLLVYRLIFSSNQKILNFQASDAFCHLLLLATSMRSEEQNQDRAFLSEPKGSLDFVRSAAYFSRSTADGKNVPEHLR
jgi:hypothetical protein